MAALVAVATAQLADLTTFLGMVGLHGIGAEANPLVAHVARTAGLDVLVVAKVGLIGFVALTFAIVAKVRERLAASVVTIATVSGLVGAASNIIAIG